MPRVFTSFFFFFFFFFFSIQSFCLPKDTVGNERKVTGGQNPLLTHWLLVFYCCLNSLPTTQGLQKQGKCVITQFCRLEVWHRYDWARSRLSALLVPSQVSKEEFVSSFWMLLLQSSKGTPLQPYFCGPSPSGCGQESLSALKDSCDSMDPNGHHRVISPSQDFQFKHICQVPVSMYCDIHISPGDQCRKSLTRETFCLPQPTKKVVVSYPGFFFQILNLLFCIGVYPINNVVVVSGEQQRDSAIHIHVSILPSHPGFHRTLSRDPYNRSLLIIHFEYGCVYMTVRNSLTIPSVHLPPRPQATIVCFLSLCLFLFCK